MNSQAKLCFLVALSACLVNGQANDGPVINTPASLVQCLPTLITFSGGTPPYYVSVTPGGQTAATPLADLGLQTGNSVTWNANIPAGTNVGLQIRDSKGVINYSQAVTIQSSSNTTCLNSPPVTSPGSGGSGSTPPAGGATPATPAKPNPSTGGTTPPPNSTSTQTKNGSSPFVPSTNTTASTNARTSPAVTIHMVNYKSVMLGLAIVATTIGYFA